MEQKTLLAIILSLLVLLGYNALFSQKAPRPILPTTEQEIPSINEVRTVSFPSEKVVHQIVEKQETFTEELQHIGNDVVTAQLTNIGGTIKSLTINQYDHALPLTGIYNIAKYSTAPFSFRGYDNSIATYIYRDDDVEIVKKYDLSNNNDIIVLQAEIKNISQESINEEFDIENFTIDSKSLEEPSKSRRDNALYEYSILTNNEIIRTGNASQFSEKNNVQRQGPVEWVGFRDRYFCTVIKPEFETTGYMAQAIDKQRLKLVNKTQRIALAPGESVNYKSILYVGPQDTSRLSQYGMGFEKIFVFWKSGILDFISKSVVRIMNFLHSFIPNWGVCTILIGLMVNGALYPLTMKSMSATKKMQAVQPKITKIRDQHKNNPQKLNKEMMDMYKEHGVNPLGGCLPMLLQMPIFIAVYQAMWRSVNLKGATFLWITDLSMPDKLFKLPFKIPIINVEYFNILPIMMTVLMFFQLKLSSRNMNITDPNQASQQKIMQSFFPLFMGVIFYKFASGLALYFITFYLFSIMTQWKMSKVALVK